MLDSPVGKQPSPGRSLRGLGVSGAERRSSPLKGSNRQPLLRAVRISRRLLQNRWCRPAVALSLAFAAMLLLVSQMGPRGNGSSNGSGVPGTGAAGEGAGTVLRISALKGDFPVQRQAGAPVVLAVA